MSVNRYIPSEFKFICWLAAKIPKFLANYFSEQNAAPCYNNNASVHSMSSVEDYSNDSSQSTLPGTGLGVESMIAV